MVRRSTRNTHTTSTSKPSLMQRLRGRRQTNQAKVTTTQSTNPITGTQTTTQTTKTHPRGIGHHGHGGNGPMASHSHTHHTTTATAHPQRRKPSMGDKVSGAMTKLRGSVTGKPGVKAAGTRRANGTDGRGTHRVY